MMFLIRAAFWICVVALLLPTPDTQTSRAGQGDLLPASLQSSSDYDELALTDVAVAAMNSAEDLLTFCQRNVQTCETGKAIAGHVQRQVVYYGGLAVGWVAERASESQVTPQEVLAERAHEAQT